MATFGVVSRGELLTDAEVLALVDARAAAGGKLTPREALLRHYLRTGGPHVYTTPAAQAALAAQLAAFALPRRTIANLLDQRPQTEVKLLAVLGRAGEHLDDDATAQMLGLLKVRPDQFPGGALPECVDSFWQPAGAAAADVDADAGDKAVVPPKPAPE